MAIILIKITTSLTIILSFLLGVFTLIKNPKSAVNRLWFFTSLAVTVWSVGYILAMSSSSAEAANFNLKIVYTGATLIPILFFHFLCVFLMKNKKTILGIGYFLAAIFLILFYFSSYIIKGSRYLNNFGFFEDIKAPGFYIFLTYFFFFVFLSAYYLIKSYKKSDGIRKKQILYIFLASIFGLGGGITNFIMDLTGIYPFGQFFIFLYPIFITYGIFLPGIKIKV